MSRPSLMLRCCVLLFVASFMEFRGNSTSDSEKDDNSTTVRYELDRNSTRNRSNETKLLFGRYNLDENSTKDDEQVQYEFRNTSFTRNDQLDHDSVRNETHARSTAELRGNSNKDDDKDDTVPYETCESSACIKLCCPLGHRLINDECVAGKGDYLFPNVYGYMTSDLSHSVNRTELDQIFQLVIHDPCQGTQRYQLDPVEYPDDEYIFFPNGSLYQPYHDEFVQSKSYCLALLPNRNQYDVTICFGNITANETVSEKGQTGIPVGLIISLPFLLVTFVVYSILPELRNMHGYTLRGYVGSLFVAYIVLAVLQLTDPAIMGDSTCVALAFVIHFSFLASFFWLNVMCFDIWWTFGGFRSLQGSVTQRERKKFVIYSIYAWGSASVLTIVCAIMDFVPSVPKHLIRPEFGAEKCWFTTDAAKALYFYGPMSITVVCNICLFISTALKIVRHNNDTAHHLRGSESRRHDDNKQWFNLYLKLFIVMGINWSMEIVSWLFKSAPKYVWYLTDLTNTLQGLIIFFIFVWKKKIKRLLLKRFGCQDRGLFSRNSTRSGCHSSASRTCTTTSGVMPMQEKINPYVQANCRTKNSSDEIDP